MDYWIYFLFKKRDEARNIKNMFKGLGAKWLRDKLLNK